MLLIWCVYTCFCVALSDLSACRGRKKNSFVHSKDSEVIDNSLASFNARFEQWTYAIRKMYEEIAPHHQLSRTASVTSVGDWRPPAKVIDGEKLWWNFRVASGSILPLRLNSKVQLKHRYYCIFGSCYVVGNLEVCQYLWYILGWKQRSPSSEFCWTCYEKLQILKDKTGMYVVFMVFFYISNETDFCLGCVATLENV